MTKLPKDKNFPYNCVPGIYIVEICVKCAMLAPTPSPYFAPHSGHAEHLARIGGLYGNLSVPVACSKVDCF